MANSGEVLHILSGCANVDVGLLPFGEKSFFIGCHNDVQGSFSLSYNPVFALNLENHSNDHHSKRTFEHKATGLFVPDKIQIAACGPDQLFTEGSIFLFRKKHHGAGSNDQVQGLFVKRTNLLASNGVGKFYLVVSSFKVLRFTMDIVA